MAQSANNVTTLNGLFKEVYSEKIKDLVPDGVSLYNDIHYEESKKLGNIYHQPVVLSQEHGFTYGGTGGDAFALNSSNAGQMKDAQVQGYEMVLRSVLSVGAASRSMSDKSSFEKGTKLLIANMLRSFAKRLEVQILYGKKGLGTVSSRSGEVLTLTDASWAPGIWGGSEGALIDIYQSDNATLRASNLEISSVSFDNRTVTTVTGSAANSVAGNDLIYYKGSKGNEFDGIDQIIRNTGTLFNISASSFNLWQGNVLGNSGSTRDLTFQLISKAVTRLVEKGAGKQKVSVYINPLQYDVLLAEQDAKRLYDSSYSESKYKSGAEEIEFHSQNGVIRIVPSIYIKAGSAYVLTLDEFLRVGSSDITFEQPGFEGEFFRVLNDANGYELRAYTDQALFCSAPSKQAVIDDLVVPAAG